MIFKLTFLFVGLLFLECHSHAENFRVVSKRGRVRVYYPNGEKIEGARGEVVENSQRWVVEKDSGLYLESDKGSKISFINSGVLFFNKDPDNPQRWNLEINGKDFYLYLSPDSDYIAESTKFRCEKQPSEFYVEESGGKTFIRVLQGELKVLGENESEIMKTMVVEGKSVDIRPLERFDYNRIQRRHENNILGRAPERASIVPDYPFFPWRFTVHSMVFWSHLLPEKDSSFSQDRFGFGMTGSLTKDLLLRKPPSPTSLGWMPRLRVGAYARVFRPRWKLAEEASYQPLGREFGVLGGLAWDGFFALANVGYFDFSDPFRSTRPISYGAHIGFEYKIKNTDSYRLFWDFGLYYQYLYASTISSERFNKAISHDDFKSVSYGFLTGPSLAF